MKLEDLRNLIAVAGVTASSGAISVMTAIPNEAPALFGGIALAGIILAIYGAESCR